MLTLNDREVTNVSQLIRRLYLNGIGEGAEGAMDNLGWEEVYRGNMQEIVEELGEYGFPVML